MTPRDLLSRFAAILGLSLIATGPTLPTSAQTGAKFVITTVAETRLPKLPDGPLYWRVETFPTLARARAAAHPTSLAAEVADQAWLFTLGRKGGATAGGNIVGEIGPVPLPAAAPEYLLRVNRAGGPPRVRTPIHMHPGSETFYVLSGELSQKTRLGLLRIAAGQSAAGRDPGTPMEVSSTGTTDLDVLVMFVLDATKPFSSPAKFE